MTPMWYVYRDNQKYGPFTLDQLHQQTMSGFLRHFDLVWCQGMPNWVKAETIPNLFIPQDTNERLEQAQCHGQAQILNNPASGHQNNPYTCYTNNQQKPIQHMHQQNTHPQNQPGTKEKGKPALIIAAAAAVILLAVILIIFVVKPGASESAAKLGTIQVSQQGGSFKDANCEITIGGTQVDSPTDISVSKIRGSASPEKGVVYQSELYRLEGRLEKLGGTITLKFAIPKEALNAPYKNEQELSESLYIVAIEDSYTHSEDTVQVQRFLDSRIDLSSNTITAEITLPKESADLSSNRYYASTGQFDISNAKTPDKNSSSTITLQVKRYGFTWKQAAVPGGSFRALYPSDVQAENVAEILNELEKQKELIEQNGFDFSSTNLPVDVYIEDMSGTIGLYQGSKWSSSQYLYLCKDPYFTQRLDIQKRTGNWDEIVITSGHELLHLAEAQYDNTGNFAKNHPWFDKPLLWMDEAVSTWYEPYAIGNYNYLPDNAKININFINNPLFFPPGDSKKVTSHGYGASLFIKYLTKKLNDSRLPSKIYDEVKLQKPSISTGQALNMAILNNYSANNSTDILWPQFLETYFTNPEDIAQDLDTSPLIVKEAYIKAEPKDNSYVLSFSGNDKLKSNIVSTSDGTPPPAVGPSITLKFTLGSLSGDAFKLKFSDDTNSKNFFANPGNFKINVTNSGKGGVMVYCIPRELRGFSTAAGADRYLSSSTKTEITTGSLSHAEGTGDYKEILFIPFNNDNGLSNNPSEITIEITYGAQDMTGHWTGTLTVTKVHFSGTIEINGIEISESDVEPEIGFGMTISKSGNGYTAKVDEEIGGYSNDTTSGEINGDSVIISASVHNHGEYINLSGKLNKETGALEGTYEIGASGFGVYLSGTFILTNEGNPPN